MKRFTKICLWTCAVCLVLGLLLISVSWAMGFRGYHSYFRSGRQAQLEEIYEAAGGEVRQISLQAEAGSIVVEEGDSFAVTAATPGNHFTSEWDNGVWTIKETEEHERGGSLGGFYVDNEGIYLKSALGEVHVTVPADAHLDHVEIQVAGGAVDIEQIQCDTMDIQVRAGIVELAADVRESIAVDCQAGGVSGHLEGSEQDYHLDMSCNLGSIVIGQYECGGIIAKDQINPGGSRQLEVSCDAGSVEFYFPDDVEQYEDEEYNQFEEYEDPDEYEGYGSYVKRADS